MVVDESFIDKLIKQKSWELDELLSLNIQIIDDVVEALATKQPLLKALRGKYGDSLSEKIEQHLSDFSNQYKEISPSMSESDVSEILFDTRAYSYPVELFQALREAVNTGHDFTHTIWLDGPKEELKLFVSYLQKPIRLINSDIDFLLLDATPNENAIKAIFPDIDIQHVNVPRKANVIQIYDDVVSKRRLENNENLVSDLAHYSKAVEYQFSMGICGSKKLIQDFKKEHSISDSTTAHFGALRGLDKMKELELGLIIGRNQPSPFGVESQARAIWPYEDLKLTGKSLLSR